jgi:hypothetical protein
MAENPSALWYFFSAVAQSAAAFAALVAVFATVRLQTNQAVIDDAYADAREWLRLHDYRQAVDWTKAQIKEALKDITEGKRLGDKEAAAKQLNRLTDQEQFPKTLALRLSSPLKLWVYVFGLSAITLPWKRLPERLIHFLVIPFLVLIAVVAIWETRNFIQDCLSTFSHGKERGGFLARSIQAVSDWLLKTRSVSSVLSCAWLKGRLEKMSKGSGGTIHIKQGIFLAVKEHPLMTWATIIGVAIAALGTLPDAINWWTRPRGSKLALYFSEWTQPFPCGELISSPQPIKAGVPTTMRLSVRDANVQRPLIRNVYVQFPATAKVSHQPDSGRTWVQANSVQPDTILYFCQLDYRLPRGTYEEYLPPLDVTFPSAGTFSIGYAILTDVDEPKRCRSTINVIGQ